ncbi:MAG TPA: hypothetical protein IAC03_04315 [Candidatus Coprenecus pullistercoris]|nr:hypothetical protein [Candidatus Coprenecus pullistercoris]
MAIIRPLNGITPKIGRNCFIAENAAIIGDVEIGDDCSVWYGAVLWGDVNPIRIGNRVNIQDGSPEITGAVHGNALGYIQYKEWFLDEQ